MPTTRNLALTALHEIWQSGLKPKHVLEDLSGSLDSRERSFLMELVYGVLRFRDTLDWVLKGFLRKPSGLNPDTLNNLRLAAYQILFMRVPDWAAVNEAVEIEKRIGKPDMVNAVLRNFLRVPAPKRLNLDQVRKEGAVPYIALSTSYPRWLIKRWVRRFGENNALALAESGNRVPPLTIRVNTLKATRKAVLNRLSEMGIHGDPTFFSPDGIKIIKSHTFRELSAFSDCLLVQDEASQLITYLLEPRPEEMILDACAAPGGKTSHIAQVMGDRGKIIAADTDEKRLDLLKENVSNLGITSVSTMRANILNCSFEKTFDRILLDAPCSSLGVIRKNPDVKYRHASRDLPAFREKQIGLLRSVARFLRRGGVLVYSVCSTEPEEGEEVIKEFLKDSRDFYIIDTTLSFLRGFVKNGFFRTYPHKNDMDGFFGVRLCRKA
ncbi:MAG TPA: 16S rRNA (cytosine(967)-C(5))-methyltransferase RsmB [Thermodesulfovibrionales bacterium]|nr:16S rRNA (cytosine(967)-C(5))-methyltransferase RsmB [Thermodesulfovibrionales bacterium]